MMTEPTDDTLRQVVAELFAVPPAEALAVLDGHMRTLLADPSWWETATLPLAEAFEPLLGEYAPTSAPNVRALWAMRDPVADELLIGLTARLRALSEPWAERAALRLVRWMRWRAVDIARCEEAAGLLRPPLEWEPTKADVLSRLMALTPRHMSSSRSALAPRVWLYGTVRRPWLWPGEKRPTHAWPGDLLPVVVVPTGYEHAEGDHYGIVGPEPVTVPFVHELPPLEAVPAVSTVVRREHPSARPEPDDADDVVEVDEPEEVTPVRALPPAPTPAPDPVERFVERRPDVGIHEFVARMEWGLGRPW